MRSSTSVSGRSRSSDESSKAAVPTSQRQEDDGDFGPREAPGQAWRRALLSPTFLLDFAVVCLMTGVTEFALPQHTRPIPVTKTSDTAELQDLFAERLSARPDGSSLGQVCWGLTTEALLWSRKTALKGICTFSVPAHISTSVG